MRINGLYFNADEAKQMLKQVKASLPEAERKALMPLVKAAMEESAGRGMNGEPSATATICGGVYQVTANVCCGGYAEVTVARVMTQQVV